MNIKSSPDKIYNNLPKMREEAENALRLETPESMKSFIETVVPDHLRLLKEVELLRTDNKELRKIVLEECC